MEITHPELVQRLKKPGQAIIDDLTPEKADLLHMAVGIAGEGAGELLDTIKKHVIYGKPLDRDNVIEELGDLEFFMEGIRGVLAIPRELTLQRNIEKLSERYKKLSYSNEAAIAREDKSAETAAVSPVHHAIDHALRTARPNPLE